MHATRSRRLVVLTAALTLFAAPAAWGSTAVVGALQQVSGSSPFAGCTADQLATQPGTNVPNSEVEPSVAAGGVDRNGDGAPDVIVGYQQDRWSDGGARGVYSSVWFNGAWHQVAIPGTSACVGGLELRASDPWVTISPNGVAYYMTLASSTSIDSAMLVNRSTDGGLTWSAPTTLIRETGAFIFNDKNSITADPFDSNFVYAVWDRSRFPSDDREIHSIAGFPRSVRSDGFFTRTTNGGRTWETPRAIFRPSGPSTARRDRAKGVRPLASDAGVERDGKREGSDPFSSTAYSSFLASNTRPQRSIVRRSIGSSSQRSMAMAMVPMIRQPPMMMSER